MSDFDDVRREFNRLWTENVVDGLPSPSPHLSDEPTAFDDTTFDRIIVGGRVGRSPEERARRLFARWLVGVVVWQCEHGTKHTDYDEGVARALKYLLDANAEKCRARKPAAPPEFCPHCGHNTAGVSRAQVEEQRRIREEIERETGLR
jgi:hypothetical protein